MKYSVQIWMRVHWVYTSVDSVSLPGRLIHFVVYKLCPDKNDWGENK